MSETGNYTVELKTNDARKALVFENWKYQTKGTEGYVFDIRVLSGDFAAKHPMFFLYRTCLEQFLRNLEKMATRLSGTVELKDEYESHYVRMELDRLGHVTVTGEIWYYSQLEQHLKFGFETDQTCLQPLFKDLSRVVNDLRSKT
jgi:hypothetical protein